MADDYTATPLQQAYDSLRVGERKKLTEFLIDVVNLTPLVAKGLGSADQQQAEAIVRRSPIDAIALVDHCYNTKLGKDVTKAIDHGFFGGVTRDALGLFQSRVQGARDEAGIAKKVKSQLARPVRSFPQPASDRLQ